MKFFKTVLLFLTIWLFIPWVIGLGLKKFQINYSYDFVIANELIILVSSLVFIMPWKEKNGYGFNLNTEYSLRIIFWTLVLQLITIAGIVILIVYSNPLPNFIYTDSLVKIFLKYVVLIPLCEEIFLRGLIQTNLSFLPGFIRVRSIQLSMSVIITSFLFGTMHLLPFHDISSSIRTFISIFILGIIAGHYKEKTGSLLPAFVAHAGYNFWGGFLAKALYVMLK